MKIYRNTIISIVIIMMIVLPYVIYEVANMKKMSEDYPVTEEQFSTLKEYALEYAKTLDETIVKCDEIKIYSQNDNNVLNVTVDSEIATVKAEFPISVNLEKTLDEVEAKADILYENARYTEISKMQPKWLVIVGTFLISCLSAFGIYILFYMIPIEFFWKLKKSDHK